MNKNEIKTSDITKELLRKYRLKLNRYGSDNGDENLKVITQAYHLIALRGFLKYLARRDIKSLDPSLVELPKVVRKQVTFLHYDEVEDMNINEYIKNKDDNELAKIRGKTIGFVFQNFNLMMKRSIADNVSLPLIYQNVCEKERYKRALQMLKKVGLFGYQKRPPSQISGGMQQRVAIARALVNNPSIIFADEPTGALNRKNTKEVLNLLTDLNQSGQSILMVTHDMKAALRASRLLYIADGNIIGELSLPPYNPDDEKSREAQVNAWLNSMEW